MMSREDSENKTLKHKARVAVRRSVLTGKIIKPTACSKCSKSYIPAYIHAHHLSGYERDAWFDIQWLCAWCHGALH